MKKLFLVFFNARLNLSLFICRRRIPTLFTIVSDDCWGGQLYRQMHIQYSTPTVGLFIKPETYLHFLEGFSNKRLFELECLVTADEFPVAQYGDSQIYFMHYDSWDEAKAKFCTRFQRVCWDRILIKIDFGKPGYTIDDIKRWNRLKFANSVAFYSPRTELPAEGIYNGLLITDWVLDGGAMFDISRRYFDIFYWLRTGRTKKTFLYSLANCILFDPTTHRRLVSRFKTHLANLKLRN